MDKTFLRSLSVSNGAVFFNTSSLMVVPSFPICWSNISDTAPNALFTTGITVSFFSLHNFLISSLTNWYFSILSSSFSINKNLAKRKVENLLHLMLVQNFFFLGGGTNKEFLCVGVIPFKVLPTLINVDVDEEYYDIFRNGILEAETKRDTSWRLSQCSVPLTTCHKFFGSLLRSERVFLGHSSFLLARKTNINFDDLSCFNMICSVPSKPVF